MAQTFLLYGVSGTFKTTSLGEAADYQFDVTKKITRLITGDSSFEPCMDQISRGVMEVWDMSTCPYPIAATIKVSEGYWPSKWKDKERGIADEGSLVKDGLDGVGLVEVEGLTMLANLFKSDLVRKGVSLGEPLQGTEKGSANHTELGVGFLGASRGTYGFVQDRTYDYIKGLKALPVPRVIVTGHEGKGEDQVQKKTIFGPEIAGRAKTDKVSGWFANTLHFESYSYTEQTKGQGGKVSTVKRTGTRAYFRTHPDTELNTVYWPAKLSLTPRQMAALNKKFPEGFFPLLINEDGVYEWGMYQFLELLDSIK